MISLNTDAALRDASRPKPGSFAASLRASATPVRHLRSVYIDKSVTSSIKKNALCLLLTPHTGYQSTH